MPTVDQVKNKVLRILASKLQVKTDEDGDVIIHYESTVGVVSVRELGDDDGLRVLVQVRAIVLWDVKRTPALYEWVASEGTNYLIGHVRCLKSQNSGNTNLWLEHNLIGDNLDENELMSAVGFVLNQADELDDELQAKFGGRRQID